MKTKFLFLITLSMIAFYSCSKENEALKVDANSLSNKTSSADSNYAPEGGGGGRQKDEFGCVVRNNEPPMTKCIESTGNTCTTLHTCQSVLKMRESGLYTEKELQQSERIGREFMENLNK